MKRIRSERGEMSIGGIITIVVLVVGGYIGFMMGVPLVRYQQVKEIFRTEVARLKTTPEPAVRKTVLTKISELGVVLTEDSYYESGLIIITENEYGDTIPATIEANYSVEVNFIGGYKHTYHFHPKKVAEH